MMIKALKAAVIGVVLLVVVGLSWPIILSLAQNSRSEVRMEAGESIGKGIDVSPTSPIARMTERFEIVSGNYGILREAGEADLQKIDPALHAKPGYRVLWFYQFKPQEFFREWKTLSVSGQATADAKTYLVFVPAKMINHAVRFVVMHP